MEENKNIENNPVTAPKTTGAENKPSAPITVGNGAQARTTNGGKPRKITKAEMKQQIANARMINPYEVEDSSAVASAMYQGGGIDINKTYVENQYGSDYFKARWMGIDFGEVNSTGGDFVGGVNPFAENYDFEHLRRSSQSTMGAAAGIVGQFVSKSTINTVGSIIGGFYGIGSAIANGDINKLFDNSFTRVMDDATEWADKGNSVFTSEYARSQQGPINIFNVEGAKALGDGMSFITGAILAEVLTAGTFGVLGTGFGAAARTTKLGRALSPESVASAYGSIAKGASLSNKHIRNYAQGLSAGRYRNVMEAIGGGIKPLKRYGDAIKSGSKILNELGDVHRLSTGSDLMKVRSLLPEGTGTIQDVRKFLDAKNFISGIPVRARQIVTGTFFESGLEARQAKDEFYRSNMEELDNELFLRSDIDENEKARIRKEREAKIKAMSDDVGLGVFTLNAAVLQGSNMIQFGSIFGKLPTLAPVSIRKMGSNVSDWASKPFKAIKRTQAELLSGKSHVATNWGKSRVIGKNALRVLKNPLTEGLEEMTQSGISDGVTDYYEDKLSANFQGYLLNDTYADFASDFLKRVWNQAGETLTDEEAYKEGVIGAVMGLVGAPTFKRNKNGKLRPGWAGGSIEDYNIARTDWKNLKSRLVMLNSQGSELTSIIGNNAQQAVINKKLKEKDDLAALTGDERVLHDNQEQRINDFVTKQKKLGLDQEMKDTVKEIDKMDLDEYKKAFGKDDTFTAEDKANEMRYFKEAVDRYSEAYDTVNKFLNLDNIKSDSTVEKMTDFLVHAIGYEKYSLQKDQELYDKLKSTDAYKNMEITEDELKQIVEDSSEMMGHRKAMAKVINEVLADHLEGAKKNIQEKNDQNEKLIEALPDSIRGAVRNFYETLDTKDEIAIKDAQEMVNAIVEQSNGTIDANEVNRVMKITTANKNLVNDAIRNLNDTTSLEEKAFSKDPEKVKEARKAIDEAAKRLSKEIKEQFDNQMKEMLPDGKKPLEITPEKFLKFLETNHKFNMIEKELKKGESKLTLDSTQKKVYQDLRNLKYELLASANKRLSTVKLAADMMNAGGVAAYRRIQHDEFNYGIKNLRFSIIEAMRSISTNDENDMVIYTTIIKDQLDKVKDLQAKLLETKIYKDEDFNNSNATIHEAEALLEVLFDFTEKAEKKETINKETDSKEGDQAVKTELTKIRTAQPKGKPATKPLGKGKTSELSNGTNLENKDAEDDQSDDSLFEPISEDKKKIKEEAFEAEVNSTEVTNLTPKILFTIGAKTLDPNSNSPVENRDINSDGTNPEDTLRYKIDNGKIRYNQGGQIEFQDKDPIELDPESQKYQSFINAAFSKDAREEEIAMYKRGLEKLQEEDGVDYLNATIENMDPDVMFYISKTRMIVNFYDKKVSIDKTTNDQVLNLKEEDKPVHSMYMFAASTPDSQDTKDFISTQLKLKQDSIRLAEEAYLIEIDKINKSFKNDPINREIELATAERDYNTKINNINKAFDKKIYGVKNGIGANDYVNFSIRLQAMKDKLAGRPTQFRVANFLNGVMPTAVSTEIDGEGRMVPTYPLVSDKFEDNPLFNDKDPFDVKKLAYVNNSGDLVYLDSNETVKINEGSKYQKSYLSSGKLYAIITTENGQKIPVKLNTERMNNKEEILDAYMDIIKEYAQIYENLESKDQKLKLDPSSPFYSFANGMTYQEFFYSVSRKWKSNSTLMTDAGGFITINGKNGELRIGSSKILTPGSTEADFNEARDLLRKSRFYVNKSVLFKKNENGEPTLNQKYLDFLMSNNIITHTAETSKLQDRVFDRTNDKGDVEPLRFQIHLLNTMDFSENGFSPVTGNSKLSKFEKKRKRVLTLLMGYTKTKNGQVSDLTVSELNRKLLSAISARLLKVMIENPKMNEKDQTKTLKELVNSVIDTKIDQAMKLMIDYPELRSDVGIKLIRSKGSITALKKIKTESLTEAIDIYLYNTLMLLHDIKSNKDSVKILVDYAQNYSHALEVRKMLMDSTPIALGSFETVPGKHGDTKMHKPTNEPTTDDVNDLTYRINELSTQINDIEDEIALVGKSSATGKKLTGDLENLKKERRVLAAEKKDKTLKIMSHILLLNDVIENVYAVEKHFGDKDGKPNFQINHIKLDNYGTKNTNNYEFNDKGEVVTRLTKGIRSQSDVSSGTLISNKSRSPFNIAYRKGKGKMESIKTDKDLSKLKFDEDTGQLLNGSIEINMYKRKRKSDIEAAKKKNEEILERKAKGEDVSKEFLDFSEYDMETYGFLVGSEIGRDYYHVITDIAIPGVNSDLSIDTDVRNELLDILITYGKSNEKFRKLSNGIKNDDVIDVETGFGYTFETIDPTVKTSGEVSKTNKNAYVNSNSKDDDLTLTMRGANYKTENEKPKEKPIPKTEKIKGFKVEGNGSGSGNPILKGSGKKKTLEDIGKEQLEEGMGDQSGINNNDFLGNVSGVDDRNQVNTESPFPKSNRKRDITDIFGEDGSFEVEDFEPTPDNNNNNNNNYNNNDNFDINLGEISSIADSNLKMIQKISKIPSFEESLMVKLSKEDQLQSKEGILAFLSTVKDDLSEKELENLIRAFDSRSGQGNQFPGIQKGDISRENIC